MVSVKWIPNSDPMYESYRAYVEGDEGAYNLFYQVRHPNLGDKQYAIAAYIARDNTSSSQDEVPVIDYLVVNTSKSGEAKKAQAQKEIEEDFAGIDTIRRNITEAQYKKWNETHPGRDGYRVSDWVIYARKKGSKGQFMPYSANGYTLPKAKTNQAMRGRPYTAASVQAWLNDKADDPKWEFEARSGKEGPSEKRMRAEPSTAKSPKPSCGRSRSIKPGNDIERLALDLVEYAYDYDTYEFKDNYDSVQEAFSDAITALSNRNGVLNTLSWFDDEDVSGDSVRRKRRDRIVKGLRGLAGESASPKSKKSDKRTSGKGKGRCRDA